MPQVGKEAQRGDAVYPEQEKSGFKTGRHGRGLEGVVESVPRVQEGWSPLEFSVGDQTACGTEECPLVPAPTPQAAVRFKFTPQPWWLCLSPSSLSSLLHLLDGSLRAQRGSGSALRPQEGCAESSLLWKS